jgi:nitrite reductase/ring-hydroxylating ferredoxin subunit
MDKTETTYFPGDLLMASVELAEGEARIIQIEDGERTEEVILVRTSSGCRGYFNRCRHLPISLDWGDGEVLHESGKLFLCRNHGALFRLADGLCVSGPCQGLSLLSVDIEERAEGIYLSENQRIRF